MDELMKKWRILWHSNAPWVGSGYGTQTDTFTKKMVRDGYDVAISAFFGIVGAPQKLPDGRLVLPSPMGEYGQQSLKLHHEYLKPNVTVSLMDVWVYPEAILQKSNVTSWTPIDHRQLPPAVLNALKACPHIWSMSKHGDKLVRDAGLKNVRYVPHGINVKQFTPLENRAELRRKHFSIGDDVTLFVSVAANKGYPSRKNLPQMIKAFATYYKKNPKSKFYVHTLPGVGHSGLDLYTMAESYGLPEGAILFPNAYQLSNGNVSNDRINEYYNCADGFILPSAGEGFGIPAVEAAAAGCPVALTDATAQAELVGPGYAIPVDEDDYVYTNQDAEWAGNLRMSKIVTAFEWLHDHKGDADLRKQSREFAMEYDAEAVWTKYMKPAIQEQIDVRESLESERNARTNRWKALNEIRKQKAEEAKRIKVCKQCGSIFAEAGEFCSSDCAYQHSEIAKEAKKIAGVIADATN